jgi:hypothetical protein
MGMLGRPWRRALCSPAAPEGRQDGGVVQDGVDPGKLVGEQLHLLGQRLVDQTAGVGFQGQHGRCPSMSCTIEDAGPQVVDFREDSCDASAQEEAVAEQLAHHEERLRALAGELAGVGFMTRGSVVCRHTRCGKATCACHGDPPILHGPYWQFSRAVGGRTVTRWVSEEQAALYTEWIANRRRALQILAEIEEVSRQAEGALQAGSERHAQAGPAETGHDRPTQPQRGGQDFFRRK